MKTQERVRMKFPCDCISSTPSCEEPWARVAKEGMFKDGTREDILNLLNEKSRTIAQLAKATKLAQPTIFRHVSDLVNYGLLKEFDPDEKDYVVERYYKPNFPVISRDDQRLFQDQIAEISSEVSTIFEQHLPELERQFAGTSLSKDGWSFGEIAHYLLHCVQRDVRTRLEDKGIIAKTPPEGQRGFIFWAKE